MRSRASVRANESVSAGLGESTRQQVGSHALGEATMDAKKRETDLPAHAGVRLISMCSYFLVAHLGFAAFVMPWAKQVAPVAATSCACAGALYVVQYLLEALLALSGRVTMHAWRADEVVSHHLTVGLVMMPTLVCCAAYRPTDWIAMLESHPPAAAVISSACLTGFNEGVFVLRSFLPGRVADAPLTRYAQSVFTLVALLQNIPMTQAGCVLGAQTVLAELIPTLLHCTTDPLCMQFRTVLRLSLLIAYIAGPLFFFFVQARYFPANLRRVVYMTEFSAERRAR